MKFFYLLVCLSILATCEGYPSSDIPFAIPVKRSYDQREAAVKLPSPHADELHRALKTIKVRSAYQSQQGTAEGDKKPVELLWVPIPVKNGKQQRPGPLLPIPITDEMSSSKSPFKIVIVNSDKSKGYGNSDVSSIEGIEKLLAQLEPVQNDLPVQQHHVKIQHVRGGERPMKIQLQQDYAPVQQLPPEPFRETAQKSQEGYGGRGGEVQGGSFGKQQIQKPIYVAKEVQSGRFSSQNAVSGYEEEQKSQYGGKQEVGQSNGGYSEQQQSSQSSYGGQSSASGYGEQQKSASHGGQSSASSYGEQQKSSGYGESQKSSGYGEQQKSSGYGEQQKSSGYGEQQKSSGYGEQQKSSGYGEQQKSSGYGGQSSETSYGEQQNTASGYGEQKSVASGYQQEQKSQYGGKQESRSFGKGKTAIKQAGSYVHVEVNSYGGQPHTVTENYREVAQQQYTKESGDRQSYGGSQGYETSSQQTGLSYGKPKPFGKAEVHVTVLDDEGQETYGQRQEEERGGPYIPSSSYSPISFEGPSERPSYGGFQSSTPGGNFGGYDGSEDAEPIRDFKAPMILQSYSNQEHSQTVYERPEYGPQRPEYGPQGPVEGGLVEIEPPEQVDPRKPQLPTPTKLITVLSQSSESHGTPSPLPAALGILESITNNYGSRPSYEESQQSSSGYGQSESSSGYGREESGYGFSVQSNGGYEQSTSGYGGPAQSGGEYEQSTSGYGGFEQSTSGYRGPVQSGGGFEQSESSSGYEQSGQSNSGYEQSGQSNSGYEQSGQSNSGYEQSSQSSSGYGKPSQPSYPGEEIEDRPQRPCKDSNGYIPRPSISIPEGPKPVSAAFDKYQSGVQVAPPPVYPSRPEPFESGPSYRSNEQSNYGGSLEAAANTIQETFQEKKANGKPFYIVIFQKQKAAPSY